MAERGGHAPASLHLAVLVTFGPSRKLIPYSFYRIRAVFIFDNICHCFLKELVLFLHCFDRPGAATAGNLSSNTLYGDTLLDSEGG